MAPLDSKDNFCGYSKGYENQPNLYLTNLFGTPTEILKSGVCVEKCPINIGAPLACSSSDQPQCNNITSHETFNIFSFCIPDIASLKAQKSGEYEAWKSLMKEFEQNPYGRKLKDLYLSSRAIYYSIGTSILYSLLYIYLMSFAAEYLAWLMVALVQIALFAIGGYCLQVY